MYCIITNVNFPFEGTRAASMTLWERLSMIAYEARLSTSPMVRRNFTGEAQKLTPVIPVVHSWS